MVRCVASGREDRRRGPQRQTGAGVRLGSWVGERRVIGRKGIGAAGDCDCDYCDCGIWWIDPTRKGEEGRTMWDRLLCSR